MTLLVAIAPALIGAILGHLLARWLYSCRYLGHTWERYQIEGVHYRDPAVETFRVCTHCGAVEIVDEIPPVVTEVRARKLPPATPLPRPGPGRTPCR